MKLDEIFKLREKTLPGEFFSMLANDLRIESMRSGTFDSIHEGTGVLALV